MSSNLSNTRNTNDCSYLQDKKVPSMIAPADPDQSSFFVMATGQIESASFPANIDNLYCRYSLVSGLDWKIVSGIDTGITQTSRKTTLNQPIIVWNFPIDITLQSTNIQGWPRICISVYGLDWFGRDVVRGYGCLMCPTTPGHHVHHVHMYVPVSSSPWQRFMHFMNGSLPEFYDSRFVSRGEGRGVTRVKCEGTVKVILDVTTKGMQQLSYNVGSLK